jgi:hypothetical protein
MSVPLFGEQNRQYNITTPYANEMRQCHLRPPVADADLVSGCRDKVLPYEGLGACCPRHVSSASRVRQTVRNGPCEHRTEWTCLRTQEVCLHFGELEVDFKASLKFCYKF